MKSLTDIMEDMSSLYDELKTGTVERKLAGELTNIAGKNLKAKQIELAEKIFLAGRIPQMQQTAAQITNGAAAALVADAH